MLVRPDTASVTGASLVRWAGNLHGQSPHSPRTVGGRGRRDPGKWNNVRSGRPSRPYAAVVGEPDRTVERFGALLRVMRERAGLTQEELAERAGLTPHAVSALERGTRTRPYPHTVRALAGALDASDAERTALIASVPSRRSAGSRVNEPAREPDAPVNGPLRPAGLVVPPTPLYGREADLARVADLTRSGTRLVTLTGLGGVGKTRLAAALSEELAAEYPRSGGTYEYGYKVLGPWWGFAAGWMFLASKISAAGTVALGLAGYLNTLVPGLEPRMVAVGAIALFTGLNYFGVRRSSAANLAINGSKMVSTARRANHAACTCSAK